MSDIPEQPKKSAGDVVYGIVKGAAAAAGVVHPAAGAAAEILDDVWSANRKAKREMAQRTCGRRERSSKKSF